MGSSLESDLEKDREKCVELVKSLLDGDSSLEEIKATIKDDCGAKDNLEEIIRDCLKNKMERKCCPEKIVNELKLKIGIGALFLIGLANGLYSIQDLIQSI